MPKKAAGLTAAKVKTAPPGRYGDGNGLYLLVRSQATRFWVFRYTSPTHPRVIGSPGGKLRDMGLGRAGPDLAAVSLKEAREKAAYLYRQVREGIDPLDQRDADAAKAAADAQKAKAKATTFRQAAEGYVAQHSVELKSPKHRAQWATTLETYAFPHMGDVPVGDVSPEHVLAAVQPIWLTKPETAGRVRARIESVLDYAKARGWRSGDNPATWRGHLALTLPAPGKVAPVKHLAALPWTEIGTIMAAIQKQAGMGALALRFAILTAVRSAEVRGALWREVDMAAKVWTIPAGRMKAKRMHRVPLSAPAMVLLAEMAKVRADVADDALIFPGAAAKTPLSDMTLTAVLRRMKRDDITVHGFRSTFRDWCGEATATPREVAEAALAHAVGDKTEAAYARGDLFDKRRVLMEDWGVFCAGAAVAD